MRTMAIAVLLGAVVVLVVAGLVVPGVAGGRVGTDDRRSGTVPPSLRELSLQAQRQSFTGGALLGNDYVGIDGRGPVIQRINRAWETAKRVHLGKPQNPAKARALRVAFERYRQQELQVRGQDDGGAWGVAVVRMRMLRPYTRWPGETVREQRVRLATVLAVDRTTSKDFWKQVATARGKTPSTGVKTVCGVITLGPTVLGAVVSVLGSNKGAKEARALRRACQQNGQRVQDTAERVGGAVVGFAKDPLGTLARGIFGPLLRELQKATAFASRQLGRAIDRIAAPDLSQAWVRQMLQRSATIALLIALVAGILGIAHAAITANLGALATVAARACLAGIVGSVVLTVLNVAVLFVDELTTIAIGASPGKAGKPFATFADTITATMAKAQVPSFLALLLMLLLLLGLVVVWWEMWLRAPLLYAVAFFYGPAYSASLFPPARQVLGQLNALLAAVVLMPLVVLSLLQMAVASLQGQDSLTAVLQSTGLVLLAAASPAILVALFSPSVALSAAAGTAGALGTGRAAGRNTGRAGTATLSAAGWARERLNTTRADGAGSAGAVIGGGRGPSGLGPATGDGAGAPRPPGPTGGPGGTPPGTGPGTRRQGSPASGGPPVGAGRARAANAANPAPGSADSGQGPGGTQPGIGAPDPRDPGPPGSTGSDHGPETGPNVPASGFGATGGAASGARPGAGGERPGAPPPARRASDAGDATPGGAGSPPAFGDRPVRPGSSGARPGVAGLPSPDQPPADPGAAQRRPPRGGGLTPPDPD
ncbi:MAG: hypothetical protein AB7G37_10775 [Solirubrobacteraceae bacterium]